MSTKQRSFGSGVLYGSFMTSLIFLALSMHDTLMDLRAMNATLGTMTWEFDVHNEMQQRHDAPSTLHATRMIGEIPK